MKQSVIIVERLHKLPDYTIGKLSLNGEYVCDTLEDTDRDLNKDGDLLDAGELEQWGKTAIPYGTYQVTKEINKKFGKCLRVHKVKHFEGILIHTGNYKEDSHGCILVGNNAVKGAVMNSRRYLDKLFDLIPDKTIVTLIVK
jgi:hypothetical protein